jgi:hypothetical protein
MQAFAEPHRRATAVAMAMFCSSLLGMGLSPFLIGLASDLLAPTLGKESLRYALLLACTVLVWATLHFYLSARQANRDRV